MPIPKPKSKEEKDKFISRCISRLIKVDPNRPKKQIIAICFESFRQSKKQ